jgi:hypothetical protein
MVGLPLLGVFGTLHYGRSLQAPPSIGGEWTLETDSGTNLLCVQGAGRSDGGLLSISQSGRHVALVFICERALSLSGEVRQTALAAVGHGRPPLGIEDTCSTGKISLNATLERSGDREYLAGTLTAIDCPGVRAAAFRAVRQRQTSSSSPSHDLDKAN